MRSFSASIIRCYEEDGVLFVAVGDNAVDPDNFLIISRLDDEDNASPDDGIGLQTSGAECEVVGAIKKVVLNEYGLRVEVKSEFVKHFGGASILAEMSGLPPLALVEVELLRKAIKEIFEGSSVILVI